MAAQARGVVVRGVVDSEDATCTTFGSPDTPALIGALGAANVHCDVGSGYGYIMHNQFFVFDRSAVWTGSIVESYFADRPTTQPTTPSSRSSTPRPRRWTSPCSSSPDVAVEIVARRAA